MGGGVDRITKMASRSKEIKIVRILLIGDRECVCKLICGIHRRFLGCAKLLHTSMNFVPSGRTAFQYISLRSFDNGTSWTDPRRFFHGVSCVTGAN